MNKDKLKELVNALDALSDNVKDWVVLGELWRVLGFWGFFLLGLLTPYPYNNNQTYRILRPHFFLNS
jgi:lysozyme family protein